MVEETASDEVYKDTHSVLSEISRDITTKTSIGLSFKFTHTETPENVTSLSAGVNSGTTNEEIIKTITDYSETTVSEIHLTFLLNHVVNTIIQSEPDFSIS